MSTIVLKLLLANCPNSAVSNLCFSHLGDVVVEAKGLWLASFGLFFSEEVLRESTVFGFSVCFVLT